MKPVKKILLIGLCVFGALIVVAFVMNNLAPNPVSAANEHSIEQGWSEESLSLKEYRSSAKIGGSTATVHLVAKKGDIEQTLRVELRKSLFGTSWKVTAFDGSPEHEDPPID